MKLLRVTIWLTSITGLLFICTGIYFRTEATQLFQSQDVAEGVRSTEQIHRWIEESSDINYLRKTALKLLEQRNTIGANALANSKRGLTVTGDGDMLFGLSLLLIALLLVNVKRKVSDRDKDL